jgi:hypothetical protein
MLDTLGNHNCTRHPWQSQQGDADLQLLLCQLASKLIQVAGACQTICADTTPLNQVRRGERAPGCRCGLELIV